jgi:hypothetical protein
MEQTMDPADTNDRSDVDRLAELVVHLTDCDPQKALEVIDLTDGSHRDHVDKLEAVARAMVRLRHQDAGAKPDVDIDLREQAAAESKHEA